ncbi:MAG TPA: hypothetical protein VKM94_17895 [Blastocatellia bacterium]|nr:hypothetical protein [Blastocatellia bacterium]HMG35812.1 hypothetical protein [Blastocatellia bacterium]
MSKSTSSAEGFGPKLQDPSIPNYRITNLDSFEGATKEPRQIAGLYFYQLLDCLVDLAYKVSIDFRKRPHQYQDLGDASIPQSLAELNARYGTEINLLALGQRNEIYLPIFGSWDGSSSSESDSFPHLRDELIQAATAFAERATNTGVEQLREVVRQAHRPFKDYLVGLQGDSVRFSKDKALSDETEKTCYPILRSQGVAAVFGITRKGGGQYPYATDPDEDKLVEDISKELMWVDKSQTYITRERISNLQRAALRGAEAIATAIDFEESSATDQDLDVLITKCYAWGKALASLKGQAKVWEPPLQPTAPTPATVAAGPTGYGR